MSTEHESGSAGPQEAPSSDDRHALGGPAPDSGASESRPAEGSAPTLAFTRPGESGESGAQPEAEPGGGSPAGASATGASVSAATPAPAPAKPEYIDAPPPVVLAAAPAPTRIDSPAVAPASTLPPENPYAENPYAENPYAAPAENPYAENPYARNPYAAPSEQTAVPSSAAGSAAFEQHPFGTGRPSGGWGLPPGEPGVAAGSPLGGGRKRGGFVALLAAVALVASVAGGAIGAGLNGGGHGTDYNGGSRNSTTVTVGDNRKVLDRAPTSVAGIAATALPSVVTIKAENAQESGTGTGFVFDTEGHILTNNHVVAPAADGGKLTVKFSDGTSYSASVVGRAQGYDVAVIKLDNPPTSKLTPLPLGDSDQVAVGDAVVAIGAPYGLEGTVTSGIISAKNRPVASGDSTGAQSSYMNALQTDASINPGNSGGPLLNASGAVIGINSAIQSNTGGQGGQGGSIGLGFAIPINQAKWVAQTLISTGTPVYAILGVLRNDDYKGDGAQIQPTAVQGTPPVTPGGPADQAGLKAGDVITHLDGIPIDGGPALVSEIWTHQPGEKVTVDYLRNGTPGKTTVTLGSRKGDN